MLEYDQGRRNQLKVKPDPPDLLQKRLPLTEAGLRAFSADVEPIRSDRSLSDVSELADDVMDLAREDRFVDARTMATTYETDLDMVVLTLETLTAELATALVDRFGVEDVGVRREPYTEVGY